MRGLRIIFENFHHQVVAVGSAKICGVADDGGLQLTFKVEGCGTDFANHIAICAPSGSILGRFHVLDLRGMDETHFRPGMRLKAKVRLMGWLNQRSTHDEAPQLRPMLCKVAVP